jgi:hypothetical protein
MLPIYLQVFILLSASSSISSTSIVLRSASWFGGSQLSPCHTYPLMRRLSSSSMSFSWISPLCDLSCYTRMHYRCMSHRCGGG